MIMTEVFINENEQAFTKIGIRIKSASQKESQIQIPKKLFKGNKYKKQVKASGSYLNI